MLRVATQTQPVVVVVVEAVRALPAVPVVGGQFS